MRLLGGLHFLVLSGAAPQLAQAYPPSAGAEEGRLAEALDAALERREAELAEFMRSPPQTNEVGRGLALIGGFLTVAAETGLPLRVFEIGASAGLLQAFDRFRYEPAGWTLGDPGAGVRLTGDWGGPPPPTGAALRVVERRACDQAPIHVRDEVQALRLQAYVWPDQIERLSRLRAAIHVARETGVRVEQADAADWIAEHVAPAPGAATVLFHSVMWQYMPLQVQKAAQASIEAAGAVTNVEAPFAWLRMEPAPPPALGMETRLTLWPGGEERLLARAHPHGALVAWLGA